MRNGEIIARHYVTGQPVRVGIGNGLITSVESAGTSSVPNNLWIAPGILDLQVNGYAGVDFQADELAPEDLLHAARQFRADGGARFLLTLITDEWASLTNRLRQLVQLRSQSSELQIAIAGWHLEGPFLSTELGYHGAHDATLQIDPTADHIREVRSITGNDPLLLTLAPERPGSMDAIALAVSLGIKVSLGHTNASAECLRRAVEAGAVGFTHLGNACPQNWDRGDNIVWRMLDMPGPAVSLIPDGIHVSPALFRLLHRAIVPDRICYVTDAIAAAGAPPGQYSFGRLRVEVEADQVVRQPGKPNLAGSALRPGEGVFRAAEMLRCGWRDVWDRCSVNPAWLMGLNHGLQAGNPACLCLIRERNDQPPEIVNLPGTA